jgi:dipeptidyl aminopeptidase/acylaminoacyl peptidase
MATDARHPMQPEDLYRLATTDDPRLSPDGARVAWVQTRLDRDTDKAVTSIWVAANDGSAAPRQFTAGPRDHSPRWSPNGEWLAFVSAPTEGPAQLFLAPLNGGSAQRLTDLASSVIQPSWSPDSTRIAFVSAVGVPKSAAEQTAAEKAAPRLVRGLAARRDNVGWFEGRRHLFVLDVTTRALQQVTRGDWDDDTPSWSDDGELLVFASDRSRERDDHVMRSDAWVVPAAGGRARKVSRSRGLASFPAFSPNGRWIAFVGGESGDAAWGRDAKLLVVSADGLGSPKEVAPDLDRPITSPERGAHSPFVWLSSDELLFLAADRGTVCAYRARLSESTAHLVVGGERALDGLSVSLAGGRLAFTAAWPDRPSEVSVANLTGTKEQQVSRANDDFLAEVELSPVERATTTSADGLEVEYFTLRPKGGDGKALPLHLEIHGGPHGMHPSVPQMAYLQTIAAAGYLVLLPNPRGSVSYGQAFTEGCTGGWGDGDYNDLMACVDQVIGIGLADPTRLHVSGYSYGGFMTTWVVGHTDRFRAAVVAAPLIDQVSMLGTTDIASFSRFNMGGTLWERRDEYAKRSPLTYVPNIQTPVLIQHWEGDLRCPIGQSEQLFCGLRLLGKEVEFVRYPGGAHISRSPAQGVDRVKRILAWYERVRS